MKFTKLLAILCLVMPTIAKALSDEDLIKRANSLFSQIPEKMPGSENDTAHQIALGERLYFEKELSRNRSQSCNSCHNILDGGAGVDGLKTSQGALGSFGRRNAPSTWNAGFQFAQNWDARAKTLEAQAKEPILNPNEMAMRSEKEVEKRLRKAGYKKQFQLAFPNSSKGLTFENVTNALAAFQRTLITRDRFDEFLSGDAQALTEQEKKGLAVVLQRGCSTCHSGRLMGGQFVMKMGLVKPYPNTEDKGKAEVTGRPAHNFLFKVPMLRNVSKTAPFFHDGEGADLDSAVFATGWHQLGIELSDQDVTDISAFLRSLDNTRVYTPSFKEKPRQIK